MTAPRPTVVVVRGHLANPWELRPWELLLDRFDVAYLASRSNQFDPEGLGLRAIPVRTRRDRMPPGRLGEVATGVTGDDYADLEGKLAGAAIVHAAELSFWFAAAAARARRAPGARFKLVQTVWETIPFLETYRNRHARTFRRQVLAATDLFLAATERARDALRLEGVPAERIEVCPPGIDLERFSAAEPPAPPDEHLLLSPGRLVWEKGHQDVLRAVAALRDGVVGEPVAPPRVLIVGKGPEEARLRSYARELGLADRVEFASVAYDEMPGVYARASALVLGSLPMAGAGFHLFDVPRVFWEEQFGMVFAEAMAAGLDIVTTTSGAIPEVVGDSASYFAPGDWVGLARLLRDGPLARPPGARVEHPRERVERYSTEAAAARLGDVYDRLIASSASSTTPAVRSQE
ncbi:MAG: phosphatidyl-myo-inositol dimannoside synthase [Solirubrobacteraceae bacterium]|jgi:glycosyltransferase involved in cell wall biosynthesis|nr:phosphatidyl-myo-inositol dimannoside synthase [Solirubrobacteraceae bacterium]